jgi:hypothetical protein
MWTDTESEMKQRKNCTMCGKEDPGQMCSILRYFETKLWIKIYTGKKLRYWRWRKFKKIVVRWRNFCLKCCRIKDPWAHVALNLWADKKCNFEIKADRAWRWTLNRIARNSVAKNVWIHTSITTSVFIFWRLINTTTTRTVGQMIDQ